MGGQAESLRLPGPELLGTSRGETHLCSGFVPGVGAGVQTEGGEPARLGVSRRLGRTPFKSRGDYEDVCCGLSALIKLMELASWPDSSVPEKENKKSVFREKSWGSHFARSPGSRATSNGLTEMACWELVD